MATNGTHHRGMGQLPVATRHIPVKSPRLKVFGTSTRTRVLFLLRACALTLDACRDTVSFCLLRHRTPTTNIGDLEWKTQEHRNPEVFVLSWTMSWRKTSTSACSINQEKLPFMIFACSWSRHLPAYLSARQPRHTAMWKLGY